MTGRNEAADAGEATEYAVGQSLVLVSGYYVLAATELPPPKWFKVVGRIQGRALVKGSLTQIVNPGVVGEK